MWRLLHYYGKYQGVRSGLGSLPAWGRLLLLIAALPGILAMLLSVVAFGVSLLALLLLTAPVYRVVQILSGSGGSSSAPVVTDSLSGSGFETVDGEVVEAHDAATVAETSVSAQTSVNVGRRQIEVKIVEQPSPQDEQDRKA